LVSSRTGSICFFLPTMMAVDANLIDGDVVVVLWVVDMEDVFILLFFYIL